MCLRYRRSNAIHVEQASSRTGRSGIVCASGWLRYIVVGGGVGSNVEGDHCKSFASWRPPKFPRAEPRSDNLRHRRLTKSDRGRHGCRYIRRRWRSRRTRGRVMLGRRDRSNRRDSIEHAVDRCGCGGQRRPHARLHVPLDGTTDGVQGQIVRIRPERILELVAHGVDS